jgi:hypothetical protein
MIGAYSFGTGLGDAPGWGLAFAGVIFALLDLLALSSPYPHLSPIVLGHARANGYLLSRVRITRFASAVVAVLLLLHALTATHGVLALARFAPISVT